MHTAVECRAELEVTAIDYGMYRVAATHEVYIHVARDISVVLVEDMKVADQTADTQVILARHGK